MGECLRDLILITCIWMNKRCPIVLGLFSLSNVQSLQLISFTNKTGLVIERLA